MFLISYKIFSFKFQKVIKTQIYHSICFSVPPPFLLGKVGMGLRFREDLLTLPHPIRKIVQIALERIVPPFGTNVLETALLHGFEQQSAVGLYVFG